jgi:hypothetical protein
MSFNTPRDLLKAYKEGFVGSYCDPKDLDKLLGELPHPLFGAAAYDLYDSGKGKLALPFKNLLRFDPGFGPAEKQVVGDCVSHSTRNAVDITRSCEIINGEREEFIARGATEGIYGSRGHGGEGMTCSGAARFVNKTGGLLIRKKYGSIDLSSYQGKLAASWGRGGAPQSLITEAQKHQVKTVSLINTVAQARDALANGYSISVCSMSGFSSRRDKYGIAARSGSWAHAMAMIAMDDTQEIYNETLFLVQNCYSDDTEILTESGWFLFKDLPKDVKVATLNRETKTLEYHLPSQYQSFNYAGKMLHFKSQNKDCLVTPNHNMLYMNSNQVLLQYGGRLDFAEASKIKKTSKFIKFAQNWEPIHRPEKVNILGKDIDINLWLEFLGFFLSEGWSSVRTRERKRNSGIVTVETDGYTGISQNEGEVLEDMKRVCDLLPWKFSIKKLKKGKNHYQLVCYNLELATYMSKFGKTKDKYIPDYIFTLSRDKQKILFDAMMKGDGYSTGKGYTTCSIKLRDTFQQLCVHLGYSADYFLMHKAGDIVNGFTANHDFYRISVNKSEFIQGNSSIVSAGIPKEVGYNGVVYCVTVQNNTVLTRRNGKILWSGQSWGVWNGGPKRHDQPEGSFWIRERDAASMLSENGSWVFSDVDGFPPRKVTWTLDKVF